MTVRDALRRATAKQDTGFRPNPKTGRCECDTCVERRRQASETYAKRRAEIQQRIDAIMQSVRDIVAPLQGSPGDRARAAIKSVLERQL
jgi:hypothetical protein